MLRLLMILSGSVEATFGLCCLAAPRIVIGMLLATQGDATGIVLARVLGAATLALGAAALMARNESETSGSPPAAAYGLGLYNVLAACVILWAAGVAGLGGAQLWGAGLFHALIGVFFVYALATRRKT